MGWSRTQGIFFRVQRLHRTLLSHLVLFTAQAWHAWEARGPERTCRFAGGVWRVCFEAWCSKAALHDQATYQLYTPSPEVDGVWDCFTHRLRNPCEQTRHMNMSPEPLVPSAISRAKAGCAQTIPCRAGSVVSAAAIMYVQLRLPAESLLRKCGHGVDEHCGCETPKTVVKITSSWPW